ncbi:hypothetical protein [Chitinophaga sp.]|uniref:hypothetical protein n=1 Tax=Chitinophaga sp. TaxID=1869181 RepID=UPI0031DA15CC
MGYDVSALTNYTKDNKDILVTSSVFSAKTQALISQQGNVLTGIKTAERIGNIDTDAVFQAGGTCGFNASGTTTITQRTITVGSIKVNESLCPKTLEAKYTQLALSAGSRYEKIPFEQDYTDKKSARIAAQLETAIWLGDTTSANVNLNKFDGLVKSIDAASGSVIHANVAAYTSGAPYGTGTVITGDVALAIADGMYSAIPMQIIDKDDLRIFCGWDFFKAYILALKYKNLYHYSAEDDKSGEVSIPGTSYKLTAVHGLDGTKRLFAFRMSNIYLGTDMENEEEKWEIFFAKEADEVRFVAEWKLGVNFAIPDEIVEFHLGA